MHATLAALRDNKRYLSDQINSYHVYIDQSMAGIQKKRYVPHRSLVLPEGCADTTSSAPQQEAPRPPVVAASEPRAPARQGGQEVRVRVVQVHGAEALRPEDPPLHRPVLAKAVRQGLDHDQLGRDWRLRGQGAVHGRDGHDCRDPARGPPRDAVRAFARLSPSLALCSPPHQHRPARQPSPSATSPRRTFRSPSGSSTASASIPSGPVFLPQLTHPTRRFYQ